MNPSPTAQAGAPDSGLIARKDVIDLLARLAEENADGALYGEFENARGREAAEAALTRVKYAVVFLPSTAPSVDEIARIIDEHIEITREDFEDANSVVRVNVISGSDEAAQAILALFSQPAERLYAPDRLTSPRPQERTTDGDAVRRRQPP